MTRLPTLSRFLIPTMRLLFSVLSLGLYPCAAQTAATANSGQHVFFLGDERLVVLHFKVFLDGKPQAAAWEEFLDRRFKQLDANGDGVLSGPEAKGIHSATLLAQLGVATPNSNMTVPNAINGLIAPKTVDGKLSRDDFAGYFRRLGLEPFRLRFDAGNTSLMRVDAVMARRQPNDDAPRILFEKLDGDGDGQISSADLRNGQHLLRKLDLDRDESISTGELVQTANFFAVAAVDANKNPQTPQPKFLMVAPTRPARQVVQQIVAALDGRHSGGVKDNRLTFAEVGLPTDKLAPFDVDGDAALDFEETLQLVGAPPEDIEIIVRLGVARNQQPIEILGPADAGGARQNSTLTFGKVQMELAAPASSPSAVDQRQLTQQFKSMDQDGNGYLEAMEAARRGLNAQVFAVVDADKDGKVFEKEYLAVYLPLGQMEQARVQLDIADRGRDLLRVVDTNNDGRLGPREFEAAADRLSNWDSNGDGQLAMNELPQQYHLTVGRGTLNSAGRGVVFASPGRPAAPVRNQAANGPPWFTKMDRNADGDVSRREFLGPADVFARLDKDGNGLIDAGEASAKDSP